jgi:hypothetical protein
MNLQQLIASALVSTLTVSNETVKAAVQKRREKAEEQAIVAVEGHLELMENSIRSYATQVRHYRKIMRDAKKKLTEVTRAAAYFGETGNPLPFFKITGNTRAIVKFCESCGIPAPENNSDAYKVPADFKVTEVQTLTDKIDEEPSGE